MVKAKKPETNEETKERFAKFILPADSRGCTEWSGYRTANGYGRFLLKGRPTLASRIAWEFANGAIRDGLCVLHRCDNPACVNVDHLFLGTQLENVADMASKGRSCHGDRHPKAKIGDEQAARILLLAKSGNLHQAKVARELGVAPSAICALVKRQTWRHIVV